MDFEKFLEEFSKVDVGKLSRAEAKIWEGKLLAVDSKNLTEAQAAQWVVISNALEEVAKAPPASQQASPIEDWREGVTPDGRHYLQDPVYPKNVKWLGEPAPILREFPDGGLGRYDIKSGSLVPVPGGEKTQKPTLAPNRLYAPPGGRLPSHYADEAGNRIALDQKEQIVYRPQFIQQQIADLRTKASSTFADPDTGTTYQMANPRVEAQIQALEAALPEAEAAANRLVSTGMGAFGTGGTSRDYIAENTARERAQLQREIDFIEWKQANGMIETVEAKRQADAAVEAAVERVRQANAIALADKQSENRRQEWEATERPYKEAAERRAQAGEERAQAGERRAGQQLELQQAQTQIGALQKQGEVGQGIIQQAVKAGVYHKVPDAGRMLRFAFDPVLEAAAIAKRLSPQQSQGVPLAPVEGVPLAPVR